MLVLDWKNLDGYWLDWKSSNQERNGALFDLCKLTNIQMWLNHSRYPSVDMATGFAKEHHAGVYKSFYDFASRIMGWIIYWLVVE